MGDSQFCTAESNALGRWVAHLLGSQSRDSRNSRMDI